MQECMHAWQLNPLLARKPSKLLVWILEGRGAPATPELSPGTLPASRLMNNQRHQCLLQRFRAHCVKRRFFWV